MELNYTRIKQNLHQRKRLAETLETHAYTGMVDAGIKGSGEIATFSATLRRNSDAVLEASERLLHTYRSFSQPAKTYHQNLALPRIDRTDARHLQNLLDSGTQYSKLCIERDLNGGNTRSQALQELASASEMWLNVVGPQDDESDSTWHGMAVVMEKSLRRIGKHLEATD